MKCSRPLRALSERFLQNVVLLQFAVSDRFVDPGQVLINNPSRAEVEMADLGISHLPFGQPHVLPARAQGRARIIADRDGRETAFARAESRRRSSPGPLFRRG